MLNRSELFATARRRMTTTRVAAAEGSSVLLLVEGEALAWERGVAVVVAPLGVNEDRHDQTTKGMSMTE
jgi:hypothetical protein